MKKILFLASTMLIALSACQEDQLESSNVAEGDGNVNITLCAPDAMGETRTYTKDPGEALYGPTSSSALGGLTNVDWNQYDLRYKVEVYEEDTEVKVLERTLSIDRYAPVNMSFRLSTNTNYRIVAWADFVEQGSIADLHYNTSDLTNITMIGTHKLNDETRDAYYGYQKISVSGADQSVNMTLRRPFAKVRIVATDWSLDGNEMPSEFTLAYNTYERPLSFNAFNGNPTTVGTSEEGGSYWDANEDSFTGTIDANTKEYALNYDNTPSNRTIVVDYIFATKSQKSFHIRLSPTGFADRKVDTDIPFRQNYLTTILGNMLTSNMTITLQCDEMFRNEYTDYYLTASEAFTPIAPATESDGTYLITSPNELVWLQQKINEGDSGTYNYDNPTQNKWNCDMANDPAMKVKLMKDIDLQGYLWEPMFYNGSKSEDRELIFDGNGHTIFNVNINGYDHINTEGYIVGKDNRGFFAYIQNGIIKNITFENITLNNACHFCGGVCGYMDGGAIDNCTAKHVWIRQPDHDHTLQMEYNHGGLVGYHNNRTNTAYSYFKNCYVFDVDIQTGGRLGGMVGLCDADTERTVDFENCKAEQVWLNDEAYPGYLDSDGWLSQTGSILGCLQDRLTANFRNCSAHDITYVYGYANPSSYVTVKSGQEGQTFYYTCPIRRETFPCGPRHKLYGYASPSAIVNIINE